MSGRNQLYIWQKSGRNKINMVEINYISGRDKINLVEIKYISGRNKINLVEIKYISEIWQKQIKSGRIQV